MRRSGYEITAEVKINKMAEKAEGWFKIAYIAWIALLGSKIIAAPGPAEM